MIATLKRFHRTYIYNNEALGSFLGNVLSYFIIAGVIYKAYELLARLF